MKKQTGTPPAAPAVREAQGDIMPRAVPMPRFMPPACCARPLARLPGFRFVLFLYEGLAPLAIAMPPLPGLLSSRGEYAPCIYEFRA